MPMTAKDWARQEYLAMLGISVQSRNVAEAHEQTLTDSTETEFAA